MSQPQPDAPPPSQLPVNEYQRWLESLDKCPGWSEWILPTLAGQHDKARTELLKAIVDSKPLPEEAASQFRTLEPFFQMLKERRAIVRSHLQNPHP